MNLLKFLMLVGIAWWAWKILKSWQAEPPRRPPPPRFEPMARCQACGVHHPVASLAGDGRCERCRSIR